MLGHWNFFEKYYIAILVIILFFLGNKLFTIRMVSLSGPFSSSVCVCVCEICVLTPSAHSSLTITIYHLVHILSSIRKQQDLAYPDPSQLPLLHYLISMSSFDLNQASSIEEEEHDLCVPNHLFTALYHHSSDYSCITFDRRQPHEVIDRLARQFKLLFFFKKKKIVHI